MGIRRQGRELALQSLYMAEFANYNTVSAALNFFEQFSAPKHAKDFSISLINTVYKNAIVIDEYLVSASQNWSIQRMSKVDRAILRIAICELFILSISPPVVIVNEAIEIAKSFGSEDSSMFVNGVLDRLLEENGLVIDPNMADAEEELDVSLDMLDSKVLQFNNK